MAELSWHWALRFVGLGICKGNVTNPFPVNSAFRNDGNPSEGQHEAGSSAGLGVPSHAGMVTSAAGQLSSLQSVTDMPCVSELQSCLCWIEKRLFKWS